MPMRSVQLVPGVNVERTLSLNDAGISQSQMIRYMNGIVQTMGGWTQILGTSPSTVRDIHAWQDVRGTQWLATGGTANLLVMTSTGQADITPQTRLSSFTPSFSVSAGSTIVTVNDPNSGVSIYDVVFFNTPISLASSTSPGNIFLVNAYPIVSVLSTGEYTINSSIASTVTVSSGGTLPVFTTVANSATVTVDISNNMFPEIVGLQETFVAPTSVGGQTVQGPYDVTAIIDSTAFTITLTQQASASATSTMNAGLAQLQYYTVLGPQGTPGGFGAGGFGSGGFGIGTATTGTGGTPITATDWSLDNWGEILLACPKNGAIYAWSSDSGFNQAQVVVTAPFFNGGIFISQPQQILVAWKSIEDAVTQTQNNLVVRWSDAGDYTNWAVTSQTAAGAFTIPTGSVIIGGLQAPNYGVIWTDVDVWLMQYVGGVVIFNFTRIGSGCGLIAQHAAGILGGIVYWCSKNNFFMIGANGAQPLQCPVWDFIFQNLDPVNYTKMYCAPNSAFNEIAWFFPSINTGSGENDSYVKYNALEGEWDYGTITRTAWIDVSVLGNPIGVDTHGAVWQHEEGQMITGAGSPSFRTGWFALSDGNELTFVDWVLPDFIWGTYGNSGTQVSMTFYTIDYPGDAPRTYGPYTVTQATEFIAPRFRGRLVSVLVTSDSNTFWRLGRIRFRYASSGRR